MNFKRFVIVIVVFLILGVGIMKLHQGMQFHKKNHMCTIGILQTATHPALDAAREGFIDVIKEQVGDKISFVLRNGQGAISSIHMLAQQFHAKSYIDGVYAIATPAAQAMMSVEQDKPVCIAAVSVTPDVQKMFTAANIYGVSDMINVRAQIDAMIVLLPNIKSVGIVYSTAEINSISVSQVMARDLEKRGVSVVLIGVTSETELEPALTSALRNVDVLLAPTDNMVASAIALIVNVADRAEKPVVVSDNMLVKYGALMARGVDYYESGKQAGELALQVFVHGKKPQELSIITTDNKDIFVNKSVAERFGVVIPVGITNSVVLV